MKNSTACRKAMKHLRHSARHTRGDCGICIAMAGVKHQLHAYVLQDILMTERQQRNSRGFWWPPLTAENFLAHPKQTARAYTARIIALELAALIFEEGNE